MENDELRSLELIHLKDLEQECAQLLGQANMALQRNAKRQGLDYEKYEKCVGEINSWYQYQQILLQIMGSIAELSHTFHLGTVSRENCYAMFSHYEQQTEAALNQLIEWHKSNESRLGIDVASARRKRQGFEGFFMSVPALINSNLHYKSISKRTAAMISDQTQGNTENNLYENEDLFQEDVRLIAKDGKLYYLPSGN